VKPNGTIRVRCLVWGQLFQAADRLESLSHADRLESLSHE